MDSAVLHLSWEAIGIIFSILLVLITQIVSHVKMQANLSGNLLDLKKDLKHIKEQTVDLSAKLEHHKDVTHAELDSELDTLKRDQTHENHERDLLEQKLLTKLESIETTLQQLGNQYTTTEDFRTLEQDVRVLEQKVNDVITRLSKIEK